MIQNVVRAWARDNGVTLTSMTENSLIDRSQDLFETAIYAKGHMMEQVPMGWCKGFHDDLQASKDAGKIGETASLPDFIQRLSVPNGWIYMLNNTHPCFVPKFAELAPELVEED